RPRPGGREEGRGGRPGDGRDFRGQRPDLEAVLRHSLQAASPRGEIRPDLESRTGVRLTGRAACLIIPGSTAAWMSKNRNGNVLSRISNARRIAAFLITLAALGAERLGGAGSASLAAAPPGPAPVGTVVTWSAKAAGVSGEVWYRFRAREAGGSFRTIRDFGPLDTLDWTSLDEGTWEIEVAARGRSGGEVATTRSLYEVQSRVRDGRPAVTATSHPLVFLFSDPGCGAGLARVEVRAEGGEVRSTPWKPCSRGRSFNSYVAGLKPGASYSASLAVDRG